MIVPPAIPGMTTGETTIAFMNAIKNGNHIYAQISGIEKNTIATLVTLTEEDILSGDGITITDILNPDSDLVYGKAVSREIKFRVMKSAKTDMIDWNKRIVIQFGLNINGTVYYATIRTTYGNEPSQITNNGVAVLEYVGYDEMSLYDRIADDFASSLTFPMYMYQLIDELATHLGIQLFYSGLNQWKIITGNPFPTKCTYRQIFSWIAEFLGTYCVTEGVIGFRFKDYSDLLYNIDYTLTPDDYYTITKNEIEIHSLPAVQYINTIDNSKNASYPLSYSGIPYQIIDNPIFEKLQDASQVEDTLQQLLENRLTFGDSDPTKKRYFPMKVEAIGNFLLEAGDIINVEDLNGNVCPLRIFSKIFTWNGGCTDIYECTGNNVRQITINGEIQAEYINEVISDRIVDSLSFGTKGMALDASQGQILNNSISTLADKVDVIGTKKSNSSSGTINCSENTKSAGCSITITPGTWIVSANATIYKCVSGKRQGLTVTSNSAAGQYNRYCYELRNSPASTTANQYYNVSRVWTVSANTTLYVMLYNGNVSTSYEASIDAVRIL